MRLHNYRKVVAILAALLPTYVIRFHTLGIPTNVLEVCIVTLLFLGMTSKEVRHAWAEAAKNIPQPLVVFGSLFLASAVISTSISSHREASLGILKGWIVVPTLFSWIVYASGVKRRAVVDSLIGSGIVVALFGMSQVGVQDRIRSVYDVPNSLALFLAPLTVLAFWHSLMIKRYSLTYRSAAAIMFISIIFTQSLMAMVSVITTIVIGSLWKKKKRFILLVALTALLLASPIATQKVKYLAQENSSAAVRLQLWSVSIDLIKEHPVLGIGLGEFEPFYQEKLHQRFKLFEQGLAPKPIPEFVLRDPHNWVLSFYLNVGIIGLISFAGLNSWAVYRAPKTIAFAIIALLIFGLTDTIIWKNDLATLHSILIALAASKYIGTSPISFQSSDLVGQR